MLAAEHQLPGQPYRDRVVDPKILDRMLEWARTADDKASRFAVLALAVAFFWIYYAVLIPATASSRVTLLVRDLASVDRAVLRLSEVQTQMRATARMQSRRSTPNNQSIPFFVDVLLERLISDPRIDLPQDQRRRAQELRENLAQLAVELERYRSFYDLHRSGSPHDPSGWPLKSGDPSQTLASLERAEKAMLQLRDLNTQAVNAEWLDAVERTLISDGERLRLGATITASLAPYESLVGTWAPAELQTTTQFPSEIALRNAERVPTTLDELRALREDLKEIHDATATDLQVRRLRIPFTDIEIDRRIFLAAGPVVVIVLYHFLLAYLVLARQIERFIVEMWGHPAANAATQLRPSDALFRKFDDSADLPSLVRSIRRPVRWLLHGAVPVVPAVLVGAAIVVSWQNAAVGIGGVVLGLALICGAYALLLAYGLWKLA